jgi:hypothetical protein
MKQSTTEIDERPGRSLIEAPPWVLTKLMLEQTYAVTIQVRRRPWVRRRPGAFFDFLGVDQSLSICHIAVAEPAQRLRLLLTMMSDRKLARKVAAGDKAMLHVWSKRASGALQVEVIEVTTEDFLPSGRTRR